MLQFPRFWLLRYGVALLTVALAVLLKLLLDPLLSIESPFLLFIVAVVVSAGNGGLGPGLLTTALAALISAYFFIPPAYSLLLCWDDIVQLDLFLLVALLLGVLTATHKQAESELSARVRQQAAVAELGQRVLCGTELSALMSKAVSLVAQTLEVEYCQLLELLPSGDTLLLRAGVGWQEGLVGQATVSARTNSYAGYTLLSSKPVIVKDLRTETRFSSPSLLHDHGVISIMSVIIQGQDRPFGVLSACTTKPRTFTQEDIHFLQAVSNVLAEGLERKQAESERQRLLDKLEESLSQLEAVVGSMTEGLIISDPEGNVLTMNPAALRIHEYQSVEQVRRQLREFAATFELHYLDGQAMPVEEWPLARALRGEAFCDYEMRVRRVDTGTVWIGNFGGTPVRDKQGQVILAIVTMRDVTSQKRSQEELACSLQREQAARAEAEMTNRIKDEFLAVLSHELRSPLNPILGWAKLLQSRKFDAATTARALETIERNAKLQTQLIEDLLDVSRILRGKLSLNVCPLNLASTIEAAIETVGLAAQAKSIQVETLFDPNVGQVSGDPNRLQQVVWNLLSNAVKFTPPSGRVEIRLERVGSQVQLQVSDTGKGINPDFLPYVFDYFRQADSATTRTCGGLGLGLAIVRHLVELHGGTVHADSPGEGQGATFTVRLPLMTIHSQANQDSGQSDNSPQLNGIRVLVVDNEADMREFLAFMLEQYGAEVTAVASALEALEALAQTKPDLLLSDIGMPEVDGYMLMRQVRALEPHQGGQIPALALSAYAGEINQQQALAAGFQKHLAKPVEPAELVRLIYNLVRQR
jgi:PAS domain S-box-containing protein